MPTGLDNFASSAKGMFSDGAGEKAILYIYLTDPTSTNTMDEEIKAIKEYEQTLQQKAAAKIGIGQNLKEGLMSTGKDILNAVKPGGTSSDNIAELDPDNSNFAKFKVQYNPTTLKLSSVNGKIQSRRVDEGIDNLKTYKFSGKTKLCFDLIFDDCDNMNAFMLNDVVNLNVSSALKKGYHEYSHKGSEYSVRKRMDAIMSLLCDTRAQQVIFYWSHMCFRGMVTDVGNKFTMFNPKGNPIRGEMHLELTQDKAKKDSYGFDNQYWKKAFENCFKPSTIPGGEFAGEYKGKSAVEQALGGSMLNLNL